MKSRFAYPVALSLPAFVVAVACGSTTPDGSPNENAAGAGGDGVGASGGAAGDESSARAPGGASSGDSGQGGNGEFAVGGVGGESAGGESACGARCASDETCCDGECVDLDADTENCGACGNVCDAPHSTAECVASECVIAKCSAGYVDCNQSPRDGCEAREMGRPGAPRLIAPTLGAFTGSVHAERALRPQFRWAAPARAGSCDTLVYELELDDSCPLEGFRECDFPSPEVHETDIADVEWAPPEALPVAETAPVGTRYFWRVRACESPERCSDWSDVRYVDVGRLRDDLNGDGYSEVFALSADNDIALRSYMVFGGPEIPTLPAPFEFELDWYADARWVGDVNGDGFADALRALSFGPPTLFLGGPDPSNVEQIQLPIPVGTGWTSASGVGDWNGDGYADFIVAEYSASKPAQGEAVGVAHLYFGHPAMLLAPPLEVRPPAGTTPVEFGVALEGGIDMNGDGLPEAFVLDGDEGRIHAIYGSTTGTARINATFTTGTACHYYERTMLVAAGDLNRDGFEDLAALCRPGAFVYLGATTPLSQPIWSATLAPRGVTLAGGYDLGGDGYSDLLIGSGDSTGAELWLLAGSAELASATAPGAAALAESSGASSLVPFGGSFGLRGEHASEGLTIGDHNGDGNWDIVAQVQSASRLRWFSGGSADAGSGATCTQPEMSYSSTGNWCAVQTRDVLGSIPQVDSSGLPYMYQVGTSFGRVLAR